MATQDAKLRMLEEMQARNIQRSKESLSASTTSQIQEILQSSMRRRDKRSALYKVKRNAETAAIETLRGFQRQYEMFGVKVTLTPADFLSSIDFSLLLDENVNVQELPTRDPLIRSDETASVEPSSTPVASLTSSVQHVPISLQPIVPIVDFAYHELTSSFTKNGRKAVPFRSYYELTVQQVLSYIGSYGEGVDYFPSDIHQDLPDYNHHLVVDYITTLRPFRSGNHVFVGKLLSYDHPAYMISGAKEKGFLGRFYRSSNAAVSHSRRHYLDSLRDKSSEENSEKRNLFKRIPYSEDWSGTQSGGLSVLVHLLLWLRKDVERCIDSQPGDNPHYHHGYFYDPGYHASYLTFDNPTLLGKVKEASSSGTLNGMDENPVRLPD